MKKPDYSLSKEIQYTPPNGNQDDSVEFPAGTLVFPFWNEAYIPSHIKEVFDKIKKGSGMFLSVGKGDDAKDLVMCIIGRKWVPVPKKCIKEVR
jgi:hypothetical protein